MDRLRMLAQFAEYVQQKALQSDFDVVELKHIIDIANHQRGQLQSELDYVKSKLDSATSYTYMQLFKKMDSEWNT